MEQKKKREIYFFDRLAKALFEDAEALDAIAEYHSIADIFKILQAYGYLAGMALSGYLRLALKAGDDLKYFLDPETGKFSEDAVFDEEGEEFRASFDTRHDLILRLIGKTRTPPLFPMIVEVENGKVRGAMERLHNVVSWFGIPYAAEAVGPLRWKKPQPAPPIERVMNCTKPDEPNMQTFAGKTFGKEGRLTLNICRPNTEETGLPVIVYFHSGNYQIGQAEEWLGNKFCETIPAVHVSVEYRMGALGFNPLPALHTGDTAEDSGNFAILDSIAALEWVRRNIAAFGGDAENVTISGFSAGGGLVYMMMASPLARGLFHKAISFSVGLAVSDLREAQKIYAERFARLAAEDCVRYSEAEAVDWLLSEKEADRKSARAWMQSLSAKRVIELFPIASVRMEAFPVCFLDGTVLPGDAFDGPAVSRVPMMVFQSVDEFSAFVSVDPWIKKRLRAEPQDETVAADRDACSKYGSLLYGHFNSHQVAERFHPRTGKAIFVGKFRYGHSVQNFSEDFVRRYGAVHGVYLPFLSDQYKMPWKRGNDFFEHVGAEYLSAQFLGCIQSFMESGDPNCDGIESEWLPWTPDARYEAVFDGDWERGQVTVRKSDFGYEKVFAAFDAETGLSEESKEFIKHTVLSHRWFSPEWDAHYGNPKDTVLVQWNREGE